MTTAFQLVWFTHSHVITMIYDRWNLFQTLHKKPPHLSYTHNNKAGHEYFFFTSTPNSTPFEIKTEGNGITYTQLTPQRCLLLDQFRPFRDPPLLRLFILFPVSAPQWRLCGHFLTFTFKMSIALSTSVLRLSLDLSSRLRWRQSEFANVTVIRESFLENA